MSVAAILRAASARLLQQHTRAISTTPCLRGLEDFFEAPAKEGEAVRAGTRTPVDPGDMPLSPRSLLSAMSFQTLKRLSFAHTGLPLQGGTGKQQICV